MFTGRLFFSRSVNWLVGSIDAVTESGPLTKEWVGLILLPIVGNAAGEDNAGN